MATTLPASPKIEIFHIEDARDHSCSGSSSRSDLSDPVDPHRWDLFECPPPYEPCDFSPVSFDDDTTASCALNPYNPAKMSSWAGQPSVRGNSELLRMILLNFNTIGITFTWGVEMTYCTPYLLSLGLAKSTMSLVWVAGPLSGLVVQPIVGAMADESTSKYGRRRPFIIIGSILVALCLCVLGFTQEVVGFFMADGEAARRVTIVLAIFSIYLADFSINAVMSTSRSLMVDTLPIEKQQAGAAWGGRLSSIGHLVGYGLGAVDLSAIFGSFSANSQFKHLCLIAAFGILGTSAITCWAVTERILISVKHDPRHGKGQLRIVRQILSTALHLPPRIQAICNIQFWSWIGWFPFMFYGTTWVGETYFRYDAPQNAGESGDTVGDVGRIGSTALVIYSGITFAGAWLLPLVIKSPEDDSYTRRPPRGIASQIEKFAKHKPDLLTAWMAGHAMFAIAMFFAPFATSFRFATVLVAICGLPWTMVMWAPQTFLGIEVNKLSGASQPGGSYRRLSNDSDMEMSGVNGSRRQTLYLEHGPDEPNAPARTSSTGELSGIYFGILNIYNTIPQFIGTFISTIVFSILEPGKSPELAHGAPAEEHHDTDGPNAIAVCLFIGAISSVVAVFATRRLKYL